ncbi:cation-transporting atpase fungi [Rhizoctonia solani AG-1 IA]|uniref:Calcium-transporting ATPase n=1 Tax=Thanatephorus cucumeris (strain AG1-IA) TaxID=983506 RepID=L8WPM6_THACA|nr:cation-transporting atpase fungi [Rhizoctonia solani AG-1 IA]
MANRSDLPTIVTTDASSVRGEPIHPIEPTHSRSPSDPQLLVPSGSQAPSSPGLTSSSVPPSPTLSNYSSVHWQDTRALRLNEPDSGPDGGKSSLLEPTKHARKASVVSYTSTVPDDKATGSQISPTPTGTTAAKDEESEEQPPHHIDPSEDTTDPAPFDQKPLVLASLVDPKNLQSLESMGGSDGLLRGLGTDTNMGLRSWQYTDSGHNHDPEKGEGGGAGAGGDTPQSRASVDDRRRVYGVNVMPSRKSKSLLLLMWLALKDKVLVLLSIAAVISLALGLYSDFGTPPELVVCTSGEGLCEAPRVDWVEGVAIMIAILIVVIVGSLNDWQKERQFRKLNDKKEDRGVKVIRDGKEQVINVKDVMVGDIALLEPGEIIPCDGVFLRGHNVRCDESGATGESDAIKKVTYEECMAEVKALKPGSKTKLDCFIVSGSKVLEGVGQYVVIAVGPKSFNGRIMAALSGDTESTPLQLKLNALAELIAKLGSAAGLILFTALMIKFFVQLKTKPDRTANQKAMSFVQILIISVTLIVVAVPEGLPLAVTLALAFATKRMTKERLLVRVLGSCETMANASVVCTDKTGTLTQNVMSVVAGSVGVHCKFVQRLSENEGRQNVDRVIEDQEAGSQRNRDHKDDFPLEMTQLNDVVREPLRSLFNEALAVNSTAFEDKNPETGELEFVGSKTETALLRFAKDLKWAPYQQTRSGADIIQMIPFSSERKAMGVVVRIPSGGYRLYLKGASEIITGLCTRHVVVHRPGSPTSTESNTIETAPITELEEENISRTIIFYANQMLRTLAVAYRDFESWPPAGHTGAQDEVPYEMIAEDLTLVAITGIEDPLRPGVKEAVAKCHGAGVTIKMCTGDNVLTARSIASQCGIFTAGGIIMEGPVFRRLSTEEQREIVPRLQVLARSSPEDKRILVDTLKGLGEIVGVTGDGTNDGPALKHANVGFSMGIAGTEIAKEASDIILMDDNFSSIVSAIMWGRCVNDSVRKFLQFQVSVNITAVLITFISAVSSDEEESVLTAVQLLWINIIMDTFAALALATDPASPELLKRMPDRKTAPLFSVDMGKMIIGQSIYQTFIVLLFHFAGAGFWNYHTDREHAELSTMVFNTFVFCQIFNSVNCRSLTQDKNIFQVAIQILIAFFGGAAFQVTSMNGRDWGMSIALGFVSIPLGFLIRCIPNGPVERVFIALRIMRDPNAPPKLTKEEKKAEEERKREEEKDIWNPAINQVRDRLQTFSSVRGARMRASSFVSKSRSQRGSIGEAGDVGVFPSLMTMVPTIVVSSVGAGWAPKPGKLEDPAGSDPSKSSAALWRGQFQIHPDTKPDDIVYKWGKQHA